MIISMETEKNVLFKCILYGEKNRKMKRGCKRPERWYG